MNEKLATAKFFALRRIGYRGPIDHHGNPVRRGREVQHLQRLERKRQRKQVRRNRR